MIDPQLFEDLRTSIQNQYGPLRDDQNPSEAWYQMQNQKNPEGEKQMRKRLFELVVEIPHFRNLIQISSKGGKFEQLCKKMHFKKYTKGDILFKQQSMARELILVVEGSISMWQQKSDPDINNEQRLIQAIDKSMKAYKREEARVNLDKMRNLEEDNVFRAVAQRNIKRMMMAKQQRKLNNQQSGTNGEMTHTNTFCYERGDSSAEKIPNSEAQQTPHPQLSQFAGESKRNNQSQQISNFTELSTARNTITKEQKKVEEQRYFKTDNICKFKRIFYHQPGDFIGEKEALSNDNLDYLAVAHSDRVLAFTISTDTYLSMFDLESAKTEFIVKCLQKQFPTARHESLLRIAYDFKSQSYDYNQPIFNLKEAADRIFIVKSGLVEVGQENLIKLALLGEGQLLGFEDCISEEKYRNFWAKSKAGETLLFYIPSSLFLEIVDKTYDGNLKRALIENTNKKLNYYSASTSKIQDMFTKAAPKKKHANVDSPIYSYMIHNSKSKKQSSSTGYLDNAFKSFIVQKNTTSSSKKQNDTNSSSNDDSLLQLNHSPQKMTQKFKTMTNIKTDSSFDESQFQRPGQQYFNQSPLPKGIISSSPQDHSSPLVLPNIHLTASPNPQKRVKIALDCFNEDTQYRRKLQPDRMSERQVKSLANIPSDFEEVMTERDRQIQNIEKGSNKNIIRTIDRVLEYKQSILNKKPKLKPTEKEDAFMTAFKYQKARYQSAFTAKKPGLPFKNRQFERLQNNLKKFANDNLLCRKSEQNLPLDDDDYEEEEQMKYPQSAIYYNNLDESCNYSISMPNTNRIQNDRPSSLTHIDMDFESQNNSINNIHVQSLTKLSPVKSFQKPTKNIGSLHLNQNSIISNKGNQHAHSRSTPFIKNIFLNDNTKLNTNQNEETASKTTFPRLSPFLSSKKMNTLSNNTSYLDQTAVSSSILAKNKNNKKEGKILDFEGIFAPNTLNVPSSTRSQGGITLHAPYIKNQNNTQNLQIPQSVQLSPIKSSEQKTNIFSKLQKNSNSKSNTKLQPAV